MGRGGVGRREGERGGAASNTTCASSAISSLTLPPPAPPLSLLLLLLLLPEMAPPYGQRHQCTERPSTARIRILSRNLLLLPPPPPSALLPPSPLPASAVNDTALHVTQNTKAGTDGPCSAASDVPATRSLMSRRVSETRARSWPSKWDTAP